jgi:histone acetyltransferase MYST1
LRTSLSFTPKVGSPELPLSDLGYAGYRSFWQAALLDTLIKNPGATFTVSDLSILTSIRGEDVVATLADLGLLGEWKGERGVVVGVEMLEACGRERGVRRERAMRVDGMV